MVALEEVMDTVTATVVAIGRGAPVPSAASVHALTGTLRAVADAIETGTPPRLASPLPSDPELEAVTGKRAFCAIGSDQERGQPVGFWHGPLMS